MSEIPAPLPPPTLGERLSETWARLRANGSPIPAVVAIALVALGAGLFWYRTGLSGADGIPAPTAPANGAEPAAVGPHGDASASPGAGAGSGVEVSGTSGAVPGTNAPAVSAGAVVVHVAGAVARPGLYQFAFGTRVADAIAAAGGAAPAADVDRLNLAAKLLDGQRIAVPRRGEPLAPEPVGQGSGAGTSGDEAAGPIDLNMATATQLETLPGVGPATAARILEQRNRQGGFKDVRDLLRVPGIGQRRFAELRDRVRV